MAKRLTKKQKQFLEAYELSFGNISVACKKSNVDRKSYYNWIKTSERFKVLVDDIDERNLDISEGMLMKQIRDGNTTAIIFHLKTKGKNRGYIEQINTNDITKPKKRDLSKLSDEELRTMAEIEEKIGSNADSNQS